MTIAEHNAPFAAGIRVVMAIKGIKQADLARASGLGIQKLSNILTGRRAVCANEILKIAECLGCSIDEIYEKGNMRDTTNTPHVEQDS